MDNNDQANYVLITDASEPISKERIQSSSIFKCTQKTTTTEVKFPLSH
jgi:hypothetical protein